MQQEDIEIQIWEFVDGQCNEQDEARIAGLIASDKQWKKTYYEVLSFNAILSNDAKPLTPSHNISEAVMQQLDKKPSIYSSFLTWSIRAIVTFFILSISMLTIDTIIGLDWNISFEWASQYSLTGIFDSITLPEYSTEGLLMPLVFVTVILGLIITEILFSDRAYKL